MFPGTLIEERKCTCDVRVVPYVGITGVRQK